VRHDHGEFFAAVPADDIAASQPLLQQPGQRDDESIPQIQRIWLANLQVYRADKV
jgi:hypothetical protein